jgi:hypothetical protein
MESEKKGLSKGFFGLTVVKTEVYIPLDFLIVIRFPLICKIPCAMTHEVFAPLLD